jgi:uncharacterized membrane protein YvbJ
MKQEVNIMCFRPPGAAKNIKCPECGMFNKPDATVCRKCGFDGTPGSSNVKKTDDKKEDAK